MNLSYASRFVQTSCESVNSLSLFLKIVYGKLNNERVERKDFLHLSLIPILFLLFCTTLVPGEESNHRIYPYPMDPRDYTSCSSNNIQRPTFDVFKGQVQFTSLRSFKIRDSLIFDYKADIDLYTQRMHLGNVLWPSYPFLFAKNLEELIHDIRDRNLGIRPWLRTGRIFAAIYGSRNNTLPV
jgi:hypothetical protein